jgi:8-amino-7-oxononanoate synthase
VVVETVFQRARSYIFTTASPPFLAAAVGASLQIIRGETWRRHKLALLIERLKRGLADSSMELSPSDSPIQPLIVGGNAEALAASRALRERGIIVAAIRPPTVPQGTARLRVSLSAAHEEADVDRLLAALHGLATDGKAWRRTSSPARTPA